MIWALEQLSKFIDIVWRWVERLFEWRPSPKRRTYEGRVDFFDLDAPFGTRDFKIISENYKGKNFSEYRRALLEMQETFYLYRSNGREALGKDEKELLYICRRVEKWSDCSKIIDAFFIRKNMKKCRLLFRELEYHVSEQNEVINILSFILSHPRLFTERQKMFFALVDYNFMERRVFIPEERELYNQLKNCRNVEQTAFLLIEYQSANQDWYNYAKTVNVSTQSLMMRAHANFLEGRRRPQTEETTQVVRSIVNKNHMILEDIVKRLDRIEKIISLKKAVENNKENGEIILD